MCGWRNDAVGAASAFRQVRALSITNGMRRASRTLPRNAPPWVPLASMRCVRHSDPATLTRARATRALGVDGGPADQAATIEKVAQGDVRGALDPS